MKKYTFKIGAYFNMFNYAVTVTAPNVEQAKTQAIDLTQEFDQKYDSNTCSCQLISIEQLAEQD